MRFNVVAFIPYIVSSAVGAVVFTIIGYFAYAVAEGTDGAYEMSYWLLEYERSNPAFWAIIGALIGSAIQYLNSHR